MRSLRGLSVLLNPKALLPALDGEAKNDSLSVLLNPKALLPYPCLISIINCLSVLLNPKALLHKFLAFFVGGV